ncbi:hypothetical protein PsYK624_068880 [Phanerochaete sordida]|uniref:Uncharacterized protein n=1 Tax=Phanerochaete sordida TaxID=48140 RepID=A0A9P3LDN2_9APHY|nr:hypothetical protein PsYK624_068880 [Phanerochaete sordida]
MLRTQHARSILRGGRVLTHLPYRSDAVAAGGGARARCSALALVPSSTCPCRRQGQPRKFSDTDFVLFYRLKSLSVDSYSRIWSRRHATWIGTKCHDMHLNVRLLSYR